MFQVSVKSSQNVQHETGKSEAGEAEVGAQSRNFGSYGEMITKIMRE